MKDIKIMVEDEHCKQSQYLEREERNERHE